MVKKVKLRLGELLVQANLITEEQLNEALENKDAGQRLGDYLTEQGQITDVQLAEVLKEQLGYPHIRLHNYEFDTSLLKLIPKDYVREKRIIPLKREKNKLFLAISDPLDYFTINDVRLSTGFEVEPVIVTKSEIRQAILSLYEQEDFTDELEEQYQETKGTDLTIEEESSPIVKILNQLFQQAVVQKASDIHRKQRSSSGFEWMERFIPNKLFRKVSKLRWSLGSKLWLGWTLPSKKFRKTEELS